MNAANKPRMCNRCTKRPAVAIGPNGAMCESCLRGDFNLALHTLKTGAPCGRNDPCPCGSAKKFKKCHGLPLALIPADGLAAPAAIASRTDKSDPTRIEPVRILPEDGAADVAAA